MPRNSAQQTPANTRLYGSKRLKALARKEKSSSKEVESLRICGAQLLAKFNSSITCFADKQLISVEMIRNNKKLEKAEAKRSAEASRLSVAVQRDLDLLKSR